MKNINKYFANFLILALVIGLFSCDKGIDPITQVDPGQDQSAPTIVIKYPIENTRVRVAEAVTSINIQLEVTDDIEIESIQLLIDGNAIAEFNNFNDYRRFIGEYNYTQLTNGEHVLRVIATDVEGKTSTAEVNFEKISPYDSPYEGEVFYMPFDGDYFELISFQSATVNGNPSFAGESVIDDELANAYRGASNAYLTFPAESIMESNEFSASFWMKINNSPDRAGILVIGPPDPTAPPEDANNRTSGFRFFRENGSDGNQRFKLNLGTGTGEAWFDGGANADVAPDPNVWHHFAFTVANDEAKVYIDGNIVREGSFSGISWNNCTTLSIMSGVPNFVGWGHKSDQGIMDELRIFNRSLSSAEIDVIITNESSGFVSTYEPKFDGEVFYAPFDGDYQEQISGVRANVVGSPTFLENGKSGQSYQGAVDSYITYSTSAVLNDDISFSFWYNIQGDQDKEGILTISPPDPDSPNPNKRTSGIRFFREANAENYTFKLNIGTGTSDSWFVDEGLNVPKADIKEKWMHVGISISQSKVMIFFDGELVKEGDLSGLSWEGCDLMSVMSGAPRFVEWGLLSTPSYMDELRIFDRAITAEDVQDLISE